MVAGAAAAAIMKVHHELHARTFRAGAKPAAQVGAMTRRRLSPRLQAAAACPLYGISPLALSNLFHLPESLCKDWKEQLRRDPKKALAIARLVNGDLGAFDTAWAGWVCRDGLLWPLDSTAVDPGQVRAIPLMREQMAEWQRAQRWMLETSTENQRRVRTLAEVENLAQKLIEALRQR